MKFRAAETREAWKLLFPLVAFLTLFIAVPVGGTLVNSFFRDVSFLSREFIGLRQFQWILQDPGFRSSLRFTLLFVLFSVPLEMLIGLVFALILNEKMPCRALLRALVLLPWAVPLVIAARTWELIYQYHYGFANFLLLAAGWTEQPVHWLGTGSAAFLALLLTDAWKTVPFVTLILLAGLQGIPSELYEQARIDRAGIGARFRYITLPMLKPALIVAMLFRMIDALRIFDVIYVLTGGGPGGATESVSLYGFRAYLSGDFGYGSAVSTLLFLVAFAAALVLMRFGRPGREGS